MGVERYRRKRHFERTPEPAGAKAPPRDGRLFVVHEHAARRLHYDLRLEMGGVLASWAVPKGPSLDPSEKHLAVRVEDHPVEYGDFEGAIPKGEYGAGTVVLWDRGAWEPLTKEPPEEAVANGHLKFRLNGEKLRGNWMLVRMKRRSEEEGKDDWLLFKERDDEARVGDEAAVTARSPLSVKSGRDISEISKDAEDAPSPGHPEAGGARKTAGAEAPRRIDPSTLPGAKKAPMPRRFTPELPTLVKETPQGDDWVHEIKLDGYRMLGFIRDGGVRLVSRNGNDWTAKLRPVADALAALPLREAVVDGEAVVLEASGISSFHALQEALGTAGGLARLLFYVFDLPYLDGYDLTRTPLFERKRALLALLGEDDEGVLRYSDDATGRGTQFYLHACQLRLEGVVSKRRGSPYKQGRQKDWMKAKCVLRQEFVVNGFTEPSKGGAGLGALVIGTYENGVLRYNGRVGTGWTQREARELRDRLEPLEQSEPPFAERPKGLAERGVHWVRPELVVEVAFTEWTPEASLRHPSYDGVREDKPASEVAREQAHETPRAHEHDARPPRARGAEPHAGRTSAGKRTPSKRKTFEVAGVRLTNPERVLYPDEGITKEDLAHYYVSVSEPVLSRLEGHVLTLVRCPEGFVSGCFFQKHWNDSLPGGVRPVRVAGDEDRYLHVQTLEGLLGLVQMGVLEIHLWDSKVDAPEKPVHLVFDFDPDEDLPWKEVVGAARLMREHMEGLGFTSFVKTTGGKGLHVVVPLSPRGPGWDECLAFSRKTVEAVVAEAPDRYTAKMSKARRVGKIYIDYLRNSRGASAIAPYSLRARPGAPVAVPLGWDELMRQRKRPWFDLRDVPERVQQLKADPWEGYDEVRQAIDAKLLRAVGAK